MAGGAFGLGRAEEYIFDSCRFDAATLKRALDSVAGHRDTMGVVERATAGLGHAGTGIRYDYCFTHDVVLQSFLQRYSDVAAHTNGLARAAPAFP